MARAWRMARSLDTLLGQVNASAPGRSKASDGGVGDAAHASRSSDHNPYIVRAGVGIVRARDFTDDPAGGLDAHALAEDLLREQDPRLRYVISNRRIGSGPAGPLPGVWRRYSGSNPHVKHAHVSVVEDVRYDDPAAWAGVGALLLSHPAASGLDVPPEALADGVLSPGERGEAVRLWQGDLWRMGYGVGPHDGINGDGTLAQTGVFQAAAGLVPDRLAGPATFAKARAVPSYPKPDGPDLPYASNGGPDATVRAFQARFAARGWRRMAVDGQWGEVSTDLCRQFQREYGLTPDGVGGPSVWTALWTR